ncbi:DUF1657 domain-containing protein [Clostridium luticellarii]|jgi:hypothetical protein|uniref:DUF1657 domain-containing protein n=1 Tax=Clostridium luticellarii TaxID=1691940 RepID=A0A2T0BCI0_9CLOT|nr:DUF1657 domain-containing protein [Clostridium luticellarii]MCI1944148.1 DUF1657 domain-containing protein [Clostridium luticellarii]MCI1967650.1 DUF1657 domain-containing protein [Clostridium luticellarii]MCI1996348.1 DUF1657 domain-containing protein [Clostridium luticellarii]MCI2039959.1 DUF1657 domain-containing protein [Clostridium luticellarii]PRR81588.1 hypothetical protein CLLU_30750 [Clostridium luticellarii]
MTVGTQMQQAIAGIQSAAATMKTFALETQDENAKKDFESIAKNLDESLQTLNGRQKYIQQQEPQYTKF